MQASPCQVFQAVFEHSPIGLVLVNTDTTLRNANNYIFQCFDMQPEEITGRRFGNVFHCSAVDESGVQCGQSAECAGCDLRNGVTAALEQNRIVEPTTIDHLFRLGNHTAKKWFQVSAVPIWEDGDHFVIVTFSDITKQKEYEAMLNRKLTLDLATGAANKHGLLEALKSLSTAQVSATIALVDMDDFKAVNDTHGHLAGDKVLELFSRIAIASTRQQDIVGRFGGDEFMLVLPGTSGANTVPLLKRLQADFTKACQQDLGFPVTFSTGMMEIKAAVFEQCNMDMLIDMVDCNLYQAKSAGIGRIVAEGRLLPSPA